MKKFFWVVILPIICFSQPQVGAIYNLTGEQSPLGIASSKGALLAAKQDNLALVVRDGKTNQNQIQKIAKQFAGSSKIKFSVGLSDNNMVAVALPAFSLARKKFISSGATSPNLVLAYPNTLYLIAFGDNVQAAAGAEYALKTLKQNKVVVLYDASEEYTVSLSSYFITAYVHFGGHVSHVMSFKHDAFPEKYLSVIKKEQPRFIYLAAGPSEVTPIIEKIRKAGIHSIIMGGDSYTIEKLKNLGALANNVYFTTHVYLGKDNPDPKVQAFLKAYQTQYHNAPSNAFAALGYDAVNVISRVIDKGFSSIKDYKGVTGIFNYSDGRHIPLKSVTVIGFENGKSVLKGRLIPAYVPKPIRFIMS